MADNTITSTHTGPHHYGPPNTSAMLQHNRRVLLSTILDRIAEIDPSIHPMPYCPECGPGYRYGDEGCRHTPPSGITAAASLAYAERYGLVLHAMHVADQLGYRAGVRHDVAEPDWPVFYIELPTGQVSWHMPAHPNPYDGHTNAEKYTRIARFGGQARS